MCGDEAAAARTMLQISYPVRTDSSVVFGRQIWLTLCP